MIFQQIQVITRLDAMMMVEQDALVS